METVKLCQFHRRLPNLQIVSQFSHHLFLHIIRYSLFATHYPPHIFAFSSPGNTLSIPSQGDRKSKFRNSWFNRTGSFTTRFCASS